MAEEMNPDINPSLIDTALKAIKLVETEGQKQPYQTLHTPVDIYIYGTESERAYKVKQFNELGFVTKQKNGRPVVVAQALGAYGLLDIDFNKFAKDLFRVPSSKLVIDELYSSNFEVVGEL